MPPVSYTQAEAGKTVRFPFVVLVAGVPTQPTTIVVTVQDVATLTPVATLAALSDGDPGRMYADWAIPVGQTLGFYRVSFAPDVGAVDPLTFEVRSPGTYASAQATVAGSLVVQTQKLSGAVRDEAVFAALVRTILRDHAQLNRLTKGRETSDGEIMIAAALAISQFNSALPVFEYEFTFKNFPSVAWLVIGTVGWIVNSAYLLRARNYLQYTDGGGTIDTENPQMYASIAQQWWGNYLQWMTPYKTARNINMAFGVSPTGVHSEYLMLSSLIGDASYSGSGMLPK